MFWDATPEKFHIFVADPPKGSRHNRGCAVDLTLYDLQDRQADRDGRRLRRILRPLVSRLPGRHVAPALAPRPAAAGDGAEGFTVYEAEWWHFDYKDWRKYPILNRTFEQLLEKK